MSWFSSGSKKIAVKIGLPSLGGTTYYESTRTSDETELEDTVEAVFNQNRKVYGSRKIKVTLERQGIILSRRKISRIMKKRNLFSAYSICKFKVHKGSVNEAEIPNLLNR